MHCLRAIISILLPAALLALGGCGGSSSGGTFNPLPVKPAATAFSTFSSASGKYAITLAVDSSRIDANGGQVLATAKVANSNGPIANSPVVFSVSAGPATVEPSLATVNTDANGKALSLITTGNVLSTTNVILVASTTVNNQSIRAYASFQVVRGGGVITFITTKPLTDPDGTLYSLSQSFGVSAGDAGKTFEYMQLIPFKVTDSNGNPRVGVPVTLSVYNQLTYLATIDFNPLGASSQTILTDSSGKALFNVGVRMVAPLPGVLNTDAIIYQAVTTETGSTPPLIAYAGFLSSLTTSTSSLVITPSLTGFGTGRDISFAITGGRAPYTIFSNNPAVVTATLQPDGTTVMAHLVDTSAWNGTVTIVVKDDAGNVVSATVSR